MPVMVTVQANGDHLRTLYISRMAAISRTAGRWRYSAVMLPGGQQVIEADWDTGVMFEHVISDGIELLVGRAFTAVASARQETDR